MHAHARTQSHTETFAHATTHAHTYARTHTFAHAPLRTPSHTHSHARTHAQMFAHTHIFAHGTAGFRSCAQRWWPSGFADGRLYCEAEPKKVRTRVLSTAAGVLGQPQGYYRVLQEYVPKGSNHVEGGPVEAMILVRTAPPLCDTGQDGPT